MVVHSCNFKFSPKTFVELFRIPENFWIISKQSKKIHYSSLQGRLRKLDGICWEFICSFWQLHFERNPSILVNYFLFSERLPRNCDSSFIDGAIWASFVSHSSCFMINFKVHFATWNIKGGNQTLHSAQSIKNHHDLKAGNISIILESIAGS